MNINRNNYEAYFLDYIEGKMNAAEVAGLMAFLAANPDLKIELDNYEAITVEPSMDIFTNKGLLKKDVKDISIVTELNFDELCIARIEGDLDKETEILFEKFLYQNPDKLKEYKQYLKTVLEPDKTIIFEEKRRLKHFKIVPRRTSFVVTVAAAASIMLFIVVYKFLYNIGLQKIEIVSDLPEKTKTTTIVKNEPIVKVEKMLVQHENAKQKNFFITTSIKESKTLERIDTLAPLILQQPKEIYELKASDLLAISIITFRELPKVSMQVTEAKSDDNQYLTINELAKNEVIKIIDKQNIIDEEGFSFWALAKSGLTQINRLTGANLTLEKTKDTTTNRTIVEFNTGLLSFYSSSKKE
jgi:hypothetical protein